MLAEINISNTDGKRLADEPRSADAALSQAFAANSDQAEQSVQRVITANAGQGYVATLASTGVKSGLSAKPVLKAVSKTVPKSASQSASEPVANAS
jgi:hypothetical protein